MWKPHSKSTFQETCFCNPKYLLCVSKIHLTLAKLIVNCAIKPSAWSLVVPMLLTCTKKGKNIRSLKKQGKSMLWGCFFLYNLQNHVMLIKKKDLFHPYLPWNPKVGSTEVQEMPLSSFFWMSTLHCTKMKFSIKGFFSKCDQIHRFLQIWSHLLKKSLMGSFIFCAVL